MTREITLTLTIHETCEIISGLRSEIHEHENRFDALAKAYAADPDEYTYYDMRYELDKVIELRQLHDKIDGVLFSR